MQKAVRWPLHLSSVSLASDSSLKLFEVLFCFLRPLCSVQKREGVSRTASTMQHASSFMRSGYLTMTVIQPYADGHHSQVDSSGSWAGLAMLKGVQVYASS